MFLSHLLVEIKRITLSEKSMHFEALLSLKADTEKKELAVTLQGTVHVAEAYFQEKQLFAWLA